MSEKQEILNYFNILKTNSFLGSSYLFVGEDFSLVSDIAKLINCKNDFCNSCWDCKQIERGTHPDLFIVEPQELTIKIEQIREAIRFLSLKSFKLKNKILVIKNAQALSQAAANAFLKNLEEPPKNSFIGVCTTKLEGILPTIISRCRKIFLPANEKAVELSMASSVVSFLEGGKVEFSDRKKFASFLWTLIVLLRNNLVEQTGYQNNDLLKIKGCEIILKSYSIDRMHSILKDILMIYGAHDSININLALNLIRMKLSNEVNH
jgi:hypothetical protein